ncbi:hypothetical protein [Xenorhabdus griffiniae]|nr:hypothetical protein [Xenorhabdus griffiniae]
MLAVILGQPQGKAHTEPLVVGIERVIGQGDGLDGAKMSVTG